MKKNVLAFCMMACTMFVACQNSQKNSQEDSEVKRSNFALSPLTIEQTVNDSLWQIGSEFEFTLCDSLRAYQCYKQSADLGNAIGYYMLGHALQHGIGVEENKELSDQSYRQSFAMLNELLSQREDKILLNFLGSAYYWGDGVEEDRVKAAECYLRSAELGNPETQYKIATCYESGIGVKKDLDKALYWYQQAAEQGWQVAIDRLKD